MRVTAMMMVNMLGVVGVLVLIATVNCDQTEGSNEVGTKDYDVMAIYYGDWHSDPDMASLHGPNWTEWGLVTNAHPRFEGHLQPNVPFEDLPGFGVNAREDTPEGMGAKIDTALKNGVDVFLFDWYWYAEKGTGGTGGGFLNGALDNGFMPISESTNKMKFALMWANQDWVDIHPAKRGWSSTGRSNESPRPVITPGEQPRGVPGAGNNNLLLQFDGFMNASVYVGAFQHVAKTYFTRSNYYRVPTTLANGTVAQCCYYAMYQMNYFVEGVGGAQQAAVIIDQFRGFAEAEGQCLHFVAMVAGSVASIARDDALYKQLGVTSTTSYCYMKILGMSSFPLENYTDLSKSAVTAWNGLSTHYETALDIAYAPVVSVGWDSSPRTLPSDPFGNWGYPWGPSFVSTPATFKDTLLSTRTYMDGLCAARQHTASGSKWCPPVVINAWNEWSESAYLEPDARYQYGKLEALNAVFGHP